ncbi:Crp/Fnr family transcriptional regulator [Sphingomonas sp. LY29]|uniref:Crp/Fnr family transcriptional regulator n=1 Tax=Sphingomonas sp. LY29 TaxID=3095341 RepID=UPI002D77DABA|nr:Crp/Fnr family transcriptional regulator [Sphingomonas sp. LY29]WRP26988.1 Crp/Fnr family transcriptional regulator [Sphingomonas sp. LY29]
MRETVRPAGDDSLLMTMAGNRLLATFPTDLRDTLHDSVEQLSLEVGDSVLRRGEDVSHSVFPLGRTTVSLMIDLQDGRSVEVATIGSEGAVGGIVSCGHAPAFSRGEVMVGGAALRVSKQLIEEAKQQSPHLRNLFCRYADYLLAQIMQTVACNSFHPIEARAARWLLTAQDRAGDRLDLTQEALAGLLGVQRTSVNAAAKQLQDEGLISTRRGVIELLDREGLEARACECHARVEQFFGEIIGKRGTGRDA